MAAFAVGVIGDCHGTRGAFTRRAQLGEKSGSGWAVARSHGARIEMAKHKKIRRFLPVDTGAFSARAAVRRSRSVHGVDTKNASLSSQAVVSQGKQPTRQREDDSVLFAEENAHEQCLPRLEACPALVLNADYQPLSYLPLSLWPWTEVMKALCLDRVRVVETYDHIKVRSASAEFPVPSVVVMNEYAKISKKRPSFSRYNVFLRDEFSCQYCGRGHRPADLTFDHVVPKSRGGKLCWENVVTACITCNNRKGSMLLKDLRGMRLQRVPTVPSLFELQRCARRFPPKYLHESWIDYLYWDQEMEESDRASSDEDEAAP